MREAVWHPKEAQANRRGHFNRSVRSAAATVPKERGRGSDEDVDEAFASARRGGRTPGRLARVIRRNRHVGGGGGRRASLKHAQIGGKSQRRGRQSHEDGVRTRD